MPSATRDRTFSLWALGLFLFSLVCGAASAARRWPSIGAVVDQAMVAATILALLFGILGWRHPVGRLTVIAIGLIVVAGLLTYWLWLTQPLPMH